VAHAGGEGRIHRASGPRGPPAALARR
jgi:hypothetical protein